MNFLQKLKYYTMEKGKLIHVQIANEVLVLTETGSHNPKITLKPTDIRNFHFSTKETGTGLVFYSLETKKGKFIYRTNDINTPLYNETLAFIGMEHLQHIRIRVLRKTFLITSVYLIALAGAYELHLKPIIQLALLIGFISTFTLLIYEWKKFSKFCSDLATINNKNTTE